MNKKIVSIFVCMLLFVTASSVTGAVNINKFYSISTPRHAQTSADWYEDFDNYTLYQFLDGDPEDGGWEGWGDDPTVGAYVTNNQSRSSPHSVDILWRDSVSTDLVHRYSGVSSGNWTFTAWQYVPSDMGGNSYFILLNTYEPPTYHWSTQLEVNATDGVIRDFDNLDITLPLVTDDWAEIRVEIDFEADIQTIYYNGDELTQKSWTEGVRPGGAKNLGAVDLYADMNPSTSVYYDDFSLEGEAAEEPDLLCEGNLVWTNVSRGATVTGNFTVKNVGGAGTELDWEVTKTPSWGEWTFDPESGENLKPEDGPITVDVTCVAPDKKNEGYMGKITIENLENSEDVCTIDVDLTTPMNEASFVFQFLQNIIQRFPLLERILSFYLLR
ncbi:MAG: hypothetical protein JSW60_01595 [Thermoplasmatales archaeon]|nr:MAG: hypothetical protein JSW60_01595 [Thermoplasmatales archaeon]